MPTFAMSSVWPSGLALATTSTPITPPAPPRFSTTIEWPFHSCDSLAATVRAVMSVPPPGANGTTKVTGREG